MVESYKGQHFFKNAFDIFSNRFLTVLLSAAVVYIPFYVIYVVLSNYFSTYITGSVNYFGMIEVSYAQIYNNAVFFILSMILSPIFVAAMYILVKKSNNGENIRPMKVVFEAIKMAPRLFTASFIYNLIISVPYILLFLLLNLVYFISLTGMSGIVFSAFELLLKLGLSALTVCTVLLTPFLMTMFYFNTFVVASGTKGVKNVMKKSYNVIRKGWFSSFLIILGIHVLILRINDIFINLMNVFGMPDNIFLFVFYNIITYVISGYFFIFLSIWFDNKLKNYEANLASK